jgi:hypothetical protein
MNLTDCLDELENWVDTLQDANENLSLKNEDLEQELNEVKVMIAAHHDALEKFGSLFEEMGSGSNVGENLARSKVAQKALRGPRNNVLNVSLSSSINISLSPLCIEDDYPKRILESHGPPTKC